jgi:hypothetical protein
MKKIIILAIAMVGLSFISCDDNSNDGDQPIPYTDISYLLDTLTVPDTEYLNENLDTVDAIIVDTTMVTEYLSSDNDFIPRIASYKNSPDIFHTGIPTVFFQKFNQQDSKGKYLLEGMAIWNYPTELLNINIPYEGIPVRLYGKLYDLQGQGPAEGTNHKYLKLTYISIKGGL